MAKTNNPSLGKIACDGCNELADIKQRQNGQKLLYLHCKQCGLDQRSGANLQAKWQAAINGEPEQPLITEKPLEIQLSDTKTLSEITTEITENSGDEWQPENNQSIINNQMSEVSSNDDSSRANEADRREQESSQKSGGFLKWFSIIAGAAIIVAKARA
jgi:hypothetical protein